LLFAAPALGLVDPVKPDAWAGEVLSYRVYWTSIPAAEATLSVERPAPDRLRFTSRAQGLSAISIVYPLDSKIVSEVTLPELTPLLYRKTGREGWGKEQGREVRYNPTTRESRYYKDDVLKSTMTLSGEIQDPLSCLYYFRALPGVDETKPVPLHIADGKRVVNGFATIAGHEEVTTPAGTFSTLVLQLKMEGVGGIFAKSVNAVTLVWITDDAWRIPVKIKTEVAVGSFTAVLQSIEPPSLRPPARKSAPASPSVEKPPAPSSLP